MRRDLAKWELNMLMIYKNKKELTGGVIGYDDQNRMTQLREFLDSQEVVIDPPKEDYKYKINNYKDTDEVPF